MKQAVLIVHNVRSAHNAGSLLRTADGLGIERVYLTGYTPYPQAKDDERLPHISARVTKHVQKTSLGAEDSVSWQHVEKIEALIKKLKNDGYMVAALEQTPDAVIIGDFKAPDKLAVVAGNEVEGLDSEVLRLCDITLQLPMNGRKESFNVAVAAAMALYHLTWLDK